MASHQRNDSGVAVTSPNSKTNDQSQDVILMQQIQAFLDASKVVARCEGHEVISRMLDRQQRLSAEVDAYDIIIQNQVHKIKSVESAAKAGELRIAELEKVCKTLETIKTEKAEADLQIQSLQKALSDQEVNGRKHLTHVEELQKALDTSKFETETLEENAKAQLYRAEIAEQRWQKIDQCMSDLHEDQGNEITTGLRNLWETLYKFAKTYFAVDLPSDVLDDENKWTGLHQVFPASYLPRTNSQAAKSMRLVAVLSLLVDQINHYVFQPIYSLSEASGLSEALFRLAETNPHQERIYRRVLLKMFENEELPAARKTEQIVCQSVWEAVADLVSRENRVGKELKKCVQESLEFWTYARAKHDFHFFNFLPYQENDREETITLARDDTNKSQSGASTQREAVDNKVVITILPHMYVFGRQVMPGLVLREYQVEAAKSEIETPTNKVLRRMSNARRSALIKGRN